MYCCNGFRNLVSLAGQRGLAILVREDHTGTIRFVMQARGIAFEDEGLLPKVPVDLKINVASVMGLQYCPACGCNLNELILHSPADFHDLATEHYKFLANLPGLRDKRGQVQ